MNVRHASLHLPARFHRPLRFGTRFRGHELLLRMIQLALILVLAVVGAQWVAKGVRMLAASLT